MSEAASQGNPEDYCAVSLISGGAPDIIVSEVGISETDDVICGCTPQYVCVVDKHTGLLVAVNPARQALKAELCSKPPVTMKQVQGTANSPSGSFGIRQYYDLVKKAYDVKVSTAQRANQLQLKCSPCSPCPTFPMEGWVPEYPAHRVFSFNVCKPCKEIATRIGQQFIDAQRNFLGENFAMREKQVLQEAQEVALSSEEYQKCFQDNCLRLPNKEFTPCPENLVMLEGVELYSPRFYQIITSDAWREAEIRCQGRIVSKLDCPACNDMLDASGLILPNFSEQDYLDCKVSKCLDDSVIRGLPSGCPACDEFLDKVHGGVLEGYKECYRRNCASPTGGVDITLTPCGDTFIGLLRVRLFTDVMQYPEGLRSYIVQQMGVPLSEKRTKDMMHFPEWNLLGLGDPEGVKYMKLTASQWFGLPLGDRENLETWAEDLQWRKTLEIVESSPEGRIQQFWLAYDICYAKNSPNGTPTGPKEVPPSFAFCRECTDYVDFSTYTYLTGYAECANSKCPAPLPPCEPCKDFYDASNGSYLPGYHECYLRNCVQDQVSPPSSHLIGEYGVDSDEWRSSYLAHTYNFCPSCKDTGDIFGLTSNEYKQCVLQNCSPLNTCAPCQGLYDLLGPSSEEYQKCVVKECIVGDEIACVECDRFSKETQLYEFLDCVKNHCKGNVVEEVCQSLEIPELSASEVRALTQQASFRQNLSQVTFCDPDLVSKLKKGTGSFRVVSAGKLVLVDGVPYSEDKFYYPERGKYVFKRTRVFTGAEIVAYLGDRLLGLSEEEAHTLVNQTAENLRQVDYFLQDGVKPEVLTTSVFLQNACAELDQCLKLKEPPPNICLDQSKYWYNPLDATYNYKDPFKSVVARKLENGQYSVAVTNLLLSETTVYQVCETQPLVQGPYALIARIESLCDWVIDDLIQNDTQLKDFMAARGMFGVNSVTRDFVKYSVIPSSDDLYSVLKYMCDRRIRFTVDSVRDIVGFESPINYQVLEQTLEGGAVYEVSVPAGVAKMGVQDKPVFVSTSVHTPVSVVQVNPGAGVQVLIPSDRLRDVVPEVPLKTVESHLKRLEEIHLMKSMDFVNSLLLTLTLPKVVFKETPIDSFDFSSFKRDFLKVVFETLIQSDSFFGVSEIISKGVEFEVKILEDKFIPNSQNPYGSLTVTLDLDQGAIELFNSKVRSVSRENAIRSEEFFSRLRELSNFTLNEIPIDTFTFLETKEDGSKGLVINIV